MLVVLTPENYAGNDADTGACKDCRAEKSGWNDILNLW